MHALPYKSFIGAFMAVLVSMETTNAVTAWPCPIQCDCDSRQQTIRCQAVLGYPSWYSIPYPLPSDLRSLHISNQNITVVSALSYSSIENLRKLEIVGSNIRDIQDHALATLPKLRRLNLSDNVLVQIPRSVSSLILLKELVLSNNFIRDLASIDFQNLTKLRTLDLSINDISTLPPGLFNPLTELRRLNLSCNTISAIHDATFMGLTHLEDLSLMQNRIDELSPSWMDEVRGLWILEMNAAITDHTQAAHLFPETRYVTYPNLQRVTVAYNGIRHVPCAALKNMPNLQLLNLSNNRITMIPNQCFAGLYALEELLLIANEITYIEQMAFLNATSLSTLDLTSNLLEFLEPWTFYFAYSLQFLYMNDNNFRVLTNETFMGAFSLSRIYLRYNGIEEVSPQAFWSNDYLSAVDLRDNKLEAIHSEFINLTYLNSLAFSGNRIHSIEINAFEGTAVNLIYLHNNSLTTLPELTFSCMPNLVTITLYGNPWHCDCKIRYLSEKMAIALENGESYPWYDRADEIKCASPRSFQAESMATVKPFQMICTTYASALAIQLIVGLSLSAVAISTALYVVQLYCKAKKLERNGGDTGKCLS